jgi:hypothetical protein
VTANFEMRPARWAAVAIAALAVALVLPVGALGADDCTAAGSDPTAAQYCNSNQQAAAEENARETQVAAASSGGGGEGGEGGGVLPFTGADLLSLAAVAAAFVAIGLALRRLATARPEAD